MELVTRAQWGARAYLMPSGATPYAHKLAGSKVHYLGAPYTFGDHTTCPAYVRKVQASHMDGNGWSDIGYSFLVCEHGIGFEGRGLWRRNSANGKTALNENHYAICGLVGSKGSTMPTNAQLNGIRDVIDYCRSTGGAGSEIKGHRDGYSTDCPGEPLYAWVQQGAPRKGGSVPSQPEVREVSLQRVIDAARQDPPKAGAPVSYSRVRWVEDGLVREGLLTARYADGHFGSTTVDAYAAWQRRLGYSGDDANGIPGRTSLTTLGSKHGFTVVM